MVAGNMSPKTKAFRSLSVLWTKVWHMTPSWKYDNCSQHPVFLVVAFLGFFRWFSTHSFIFKELRVIDSWYISSWPDKPGNILSMWFFLAVSGSLSFIPGLRDVLLGLCPRLWSHAQRPCEKCCGAEGWRHSCQGGHEATGADTRDLHSQRAGIADIDKAGMENVLG